MPPARPKKLGEAPPKSAPQPQPQPPTPQAAVDRRSARQIATGRLEIDARLDLHGMHQSQAHERGARHVLIITGKGAAQLAGGGERGVLKRAVPVWLTEPPLNTIVLGWSPAHRWHGGDGALYVRLKRPAAR